MVLFRVPESPATSGFSATHFNDLPAAQPAAGVQLISAPSASNSGDANLSYPIAMPQGRNGLQPSLNINYNSSLHNGWLGLGWDLPIPSLTLETRWGVPRFDANLESETYVLDGEQLLFVLGASESTNGTNYLAHREETWVEREENRQFYKRRQSPSGFERIIRRGNSPSTYTWEVTDRNGIIYYYGGFGTVNEDAVHRAAIDNSITKWNLVRIEDPYSNYIEYQYNKILEALPGSSDVGQYSYLNKILYTGHADTNLPPGYVINFKHSTFIDRMDEEIKVIAGAITYCKELLGEIEIKENVGGQRLISRHILRHGRGSYQKSNLVELQTEDAGGNLFYKHIFDYYQHSDLPPAFDPQHIWNTNNDNAAIGNSIAYNGPMNGANLLFSPLGGHASEGANFGFYVGVGPQDGKVTKSNTIGLKFDHSSSEGEGRVLFVDIDGDNLPDKVYRDKDGNYFYRKNLSRSSDRHYYGSSSELNTVYGAPTQIVVPVGLSMSNSESWTTSIGVQGLAGPVRLGYAGYWGAQKTLSYLKDVNGDGLVDIVHKGTVYFNRIVGGMPTFDSASAGAPCPIDPQSSFDPSLFSLTQLEIDSLVYSHPMMDVIKVWEAPFTGNVAISGTATYSPDIEFVDGCRISMQHNSVELAGMPHDFNAPGQSIATNVSSFPVQKGDIILFRLQSGTELESNGSDDVVIWDPTINYTNLPVGIPAIDNFQGDNTQYKYTSDVLYSQPSPISISEVGIYELVGTLSSENLTEDVDVSLFQVYDAVTDSEVNLQLASWTLLANSTASLTIPTSGNPPTFNLINGDILELRAESKSNVNWQNVTYDLEWRNITNPDTIVPFIDKRYYSLQFGSFGLNTFSSAGDVNFESEIVLDPSFSGNTELYLNFKSIDGTTSDDVALEEQILIPIINGIPQNVTSTISVPDPLIFETYFTFSTMSCELIDNIQQLSIKLDGISQDVPLTASCRAKNFYFNKGHRNWTEMVYYPKDINGDGMITEVVNLLNLSIPEDGDFDDNSTLNDVWVTVFCLDTLSSSIDYQWSSGDPTTYIRRDTMRSSRFGLDEIIPTFNSSSGNASTYAAPELINRIKGRSVSAGVTLNQALDIGANDGKGKSQSMIEYMDLNGDRFPDIIGRSSIQYTDHRAAYQASIPMTSGVRNTHTESEIDCPLCISSGGNFLKAIGALLQNDNEETHNGNINSEDAGKASLTPNLAVNKTIDRSQVSWADINGDGLPDQILNNGYVLLNLGYSFTGPVAWNSLRSAEGSSTNFSFGVGLSVDNGSFTAGFGGSYSVNPSGYTYTDVNGDGLLDIVSDEAFNSFDRVLINLGNSFIPCSEISPPDKRVNLAKQAGVGLNIGFSVPIVPPLSPVKVIFRIFKWCELWIQPY